MAVKVKMNFSTQTPEELLTSGNNIVSRMDGNSDFPNPLPPLIDLTNELSDLSVCITQAQDGSKTARSLLNERAKIVAIMLTQLGHYVEYTANGRESLIIGAGFSVKVNIPLTTPPVAPTNFTISKTEKRGTILLKWDKSIGARCYVIFENKDTQLAEDQWVQKDIIVKTKYIIENFDLSVRSGFKIMPIGSLGKGNFSDVTLTPDW